MADYGLLAGLGEGLKAGIGGYQDAKRMALEQEKAKRDEAHQSSMEKLLAAKSGYQIDQSGELSPVPGYHDSEKAKTEAEARYYGAKADELNRPEVPDSTDELNRLIKESTLRERGQKEDKDKFDKTPKGRLEKLGADSKQKLGLITSGLQNVTNYEKAYNKGDRQGYLTPQTPVIGGLINSTPIDEARINASEAIGRLNSGGAINKEEEQRFYKMIPTAADDDVTAHRKLAQLRQEMEMKLTGYGFQPKELGEAGYDPASLGYGHDAQPQGLMMTPDVVNYAKVHGITPEAAMKIKEARGGK